MDIRTIGMLMVLTATASSFAEEAQNTRPTATPTETNKPASSRFFERMDLNKDKTITFEEFKQSHDAKLQRQFERLDVNKDKKITQEEHAQVRTKFSEMMRNRMEKRKLEAENTPAVEEDPHSH